MRRGLTLIELILSMVIIAIVFTVIPKLIIAMNQTSNTAAKEEAMYNALALMGAIINLPWDESNTLHDQILKVSPSSAYDCNTTSGYRIGGFVGGRNCREENTTAYTASPLGLEGSDINDLDDYQSDINTSNDCASSLHTLTPIITYAPDPSPSGPITLSDANLSSGSSNTKNILIKVGDKRSGCLSTFHYQAYNIGQMHLNSRSWE